MSSSDASDLVDSDESGAAPPPRKKRVLVQRSKSASSRRGAKKPRLERGGEAAAGVGRTKGDRHMCFIADVGGRKCRYDLSESCVVLVACLCMHPLVYRRM